ncbi:MAG: ATP-dependent DNA helicase [bacterium]
MSDVGEALARVVASVGGEPRGGQEEMARAVDGSMADGRHLLVQAGTGTGKSFGYLVPAALQAARTGPVVVATATLALQRQLVSSDLPAVQDALRDYLDDEVTFAVPKGRNNDVCLERLNRDAGDDDDGALMPVPTGTLARHAREVTAWARETETGDRDEFGAPIDARVWRGISVSRRECVGETSCAFGSECFTALRREKAAAADIIVTNPAMLSVHYLEGIPVLPDHSVVVIDEGHELVDRATQALTVELGARTLENAVARSRRLVDPETYERLAEAADDLVGAIGAQSPGRLARPDADSHRGLLLALTGVRDAARAALSSLEGTRRDSAGASPVDDARRQRARAALDEVFEVAGRFIALREDEVAWVDASSQAVHLAPLDVSQRVAREIFDRIPTVVTSATLTVGGGFEPLMRGLGLEESDATTLDVGSPFDYARQGILYVAAHLPPPGRDGIPEEALDEIGDLVEAASGRTLILCSSWRAVDRVAEYLGVRCTTGVLAQRRGEPVGALVEQFAADPSLSLVGTMSLWQGVDLPGGTCIQVIVDRIPFPRPDDPVFSARQEAVDAAGGSGFAAVAVPRAGLLLAQGAGRLIRTERDRGVVAVLDPRLSTAGSGGRLRASLPPLWPTTDRGQVLAALRRLSESLDSEGVDSEDPERSDAADRS